MVLENEILLNGFIQQVGFQQVADEVKKLHSDDDFIFVPISFNPFLCQLDKQMQNESLVILSKLTKISKTILEDPTFINTIGILLNFQHPLKYEQQMPKTQEDTSYYAYGQHILKLYKFIRSLIKIQSQDKDVELFFLQLFDLTVTFNVGLPFSMNNICFFSSSLRMKGDKKFPTLKPSILEILESHQETNFTETFSISIQDVKNYSKNISDSVPYDSVSFRNLFVQTIAKILNEKYGDFTADILPQYSTNYVTSFRYKFGRRVNSITIPLLFGDESELDIILQKRSESFLLYYPEMPYSQMLQLAITGGSGVFLLLGKFTMIVIEVLSEEPVFKTMDNEIDGNIIQNVPIRIKHFNIEKSGVGAGLFLLCFLSEFLSKTLSHRYLRSINGLKRTIERPNDIKQYRYRFLENTWKDKFAKFCLNERQVYVHSDYSFLFIEKSVLLEDIKKLDFSNFKSLKEFQLNQVIWGAKPDTKHSIIFKTKDNKILKIYDPIRCDKYNRSKLRSFNGALVEMLTMWMSEVEAYSRLIDEKGNPVHCPCLFEYGFIQYSFHSGIYAGGFYLLMDFVDADLKVKRSDLEVMEAAVGDMHDIGVIHNSLHTDNFFINRESGEAFFIDFGRATFIDKSYHFHTFDEDFEDRKDYDIMYVQDSLFKSWY